MAVLRAFLDNDGAVDAGFSSPESMAAFDGESGESVVRDRFGSFGLGGTSVHRFVGSLVGGFVGWLARSLVSITTTEGKSWGEREAYSSDPSLDPRFRPLEFRTLESGFALFASSILFKTASSYSASREFIVVLRLRVTSLAFLDSFGVSSRAGR